MNLSLKVNDGRPVKSMNENPLLLLLFLLLLLLYYTWAKDEIY